MLNEIHSLYVSEHVKPLRELLSDKNTWLWTKSLDVQFNELKSLGSEAVSLVTFDPNKETHTSADTSSFGIGEVLVQKFMNNRMPVQFILWTLRAVETQYSQIEKEVLALIWAYKRFVLGMKFELLTDHKLLVEILDRSP